MASIFFNIKNKVINKTVIKTTNKTLDFGVLTKLIKGVKITRIEPDTLLIKKRGYRKILFQKSFILKFNKLSYYKMNYHAIMFMYENSLRLCSSVVRAGDS